MSAPMIDAVGLEKTYRDHQGRSVPVLKGVSLQLQRGDFVSIQGNSGCGKSTLLNILGCLDRPDAGRYRLDDQDVGDWPERRRAVVRNRRMGFVFQQFHLLPFLTAAENVSLPFLYSGSAASREQIYQQLASVGLAGKEERYPGELSGGEQQRVAIARALATGADLILADEPTGNLDSATAQSILNLFQKLVEQGKTVVLVTHDATVAGRARKALCLEEGWLRGDS